VHALPGAVGFGGLVVTVTDTVSHATTTATSSADGSFATNLPAAVNDTLSLTATDVVGNVSAPTLISVRSTPSLPPSSGNTSLVYQGNLVDRVGLIAGSLVPDGLPDAVFTLSLSIGSNITRTLSYIDLTGGSFLRSTRAGNAPLGVAADVGSPLLNSPSGPVSFPMTTGATLTLFAGDGGFIQPGTTYTATAVFTDGSQFVGSFTLVPPADRQYVAHSATITASPATVVVNGTTPGTSTLTITNIKDINGTVVPDGAMVALSAVNMASQDPTGIGIVSAGGTIVDGTPAANNANFKVYAIQNGTVTASYSSQPVTPASLTGALTVIQMQAADANGNVLGTHAVATLDLNVRASTDQAIVAPVPAELYADKADHRSHFTIQVRNTLGNAVRDERLAEKNINQKDLREANRRVILASTKIGEKGEEKISGSGLGGFLVVFGFGFLIYMTVLLYGQMVLGAVVEEKETRIAEILFSSIRSFPLMMGKLVGVSLVALSQLSIWGLAFAALTLAAAARGIPMALPHVPAAMFLYLLLYFLMGFFIYATIYAVIGSMVTTTQEGAQLAMPVMAILAISLWSSLAVIRSPNSSLAFWGSMFPFSAPITMLVRIVTETPPLWQILLSLGIGVVTIVGLVWLASRIYRIGMLMTGKKATIPEVWRWVRQA